MLRAPMRTGRLLRSGRGRSPISAVPLACIAFCLTLTSYLGEGGKPVCACLCAGAGAPKSEEGGERERKAETRDGQEKTSMRPRKWWLMQSTSASQLLTSARAGMSRNFISCRFRFCVAGKNFFSENKSFLATSPPKKERLCFSSSVVFRSCSPFCAFPPLF